MKKYEKRILPVLAIIFNNKGEILLTRRFDRRSIYHNRWQLPGGGIEFGEHPSDTAIREAKEETGAIIKLLANHPIVLHHVDTMRLVHTIALAYIAQYIKGRIDTGNDTETAEARWFDSSKITSLDCLPIVKEMIEEARRVKTP